jgi:hypothetical protein
VSNPVIISDPHSKTAIAEATQPENAVLNPKPQSPDSALTDSIDNPEQVTANNLFGVPDEPASMPEESPTTEDVVSNADIGEAAEEKDHDDESLDALVTTELPDAPVIQATTTPESTKPSPATDETLLAETVPDAEAIESPVEVMRPSRTALAVWRMSSRWSLAAAIYAKGQPEERYRDSLDQAKYAAELVGIELPVFPVSEGMPLETAVISYLLDANTTTFVDNLGEEYIPEYQSLAELAIRTNALLLVYTPKSQQLDPLVSSIYQAAERSGLPLELWTDLISMLERRESFATVKQHVLSFHAAVAGYLAGEE